MRERHVPSQLGSHAGFSQSRGLRDLAVLFWLVCFVQKHDGVPDAQGVAVQFQKMLVRMDIFEVFHWFSMCPNPMTMQQFLFSVRGVLVRGDSDIVCRVSPRVSEYDSL